MNVIEMQYRHDRAIRFMNVFLVKREAERRELLSKQQNADARRKR